MKDDQPTVYSPTGDWLIVDRYPVRGRSLLRGGGDVFQASTRRCVTCGVLASSCGRSSPAACSRTSAGPTPTRRREWRKVGWTTDTTVLLVSFDLHCLVTSEMTVVDDSPIRRTVQSNYISLMFFSLMLI